MNLKESLELIQRTNEITFQFIPLAGETVRAQQDVDAHIVQTLRASLGDKAIVLAGRVT